MPACARGGVREGPRHQTTSLGSSARSGTERYEGCRERRRRRDPKKYEMHRVCSPRQLCSSAGGGVLGDLASSPVLESRGSLCVYMCMSTRRARRAGESTNHLEEHGIHVSLWGTMMGQSGVLRHAVRTLNVGGTSASPRVFLTRIPSIRSSHHLPFFLFVNFFLFICFLILFSLDSSAVGATRVPLFSTAREIYASVIYQRRYGKQHCECD